MDYLVARKFHDWTCCKGGILSRYHAGIEHKLKTAVHLQFAKDYIDKPEGLRTDQQSSVMCSCTLATQEGSNTHRYVILNEFPH